MKKMQYILIGFQENFENINNLKYFNSIKKKFLIIFKIKIIKNKFYKGNFFKNKIIFILLLKKLKVKLF